MLLYTKYVYLIWEFPVCSWLTTRFSDSYRTPLLSFKSDLSLSVLEFHFARDHSEPFYVKQHNGNIGYNAVFAVCCLRCFCGVEQRPFDSLQALALSYYYHLSTMYDGTSVQTTYKMSIIYVYWERTIQHTQVIITVLYVDIP